MTPRWRHKVFLGSDFWRLGREGVVARVHQVAFAKFHWDVGDVTRVSVIAEGDEATLEGAKKAALKRLGVGR